MCSPLKQFNRATSIKTPRSHSISCEARWRLYIYIYIYIYMYIWLFFFALEQESNSVRIMALRTLLNSWATSRRYHENIQLSCVFGCGSLHPLLPGSDVSDSLAHYLVCPCLWHLLESRLQTPLPTLPSQRLFLTGHFEISRYQVYRPRPQCFSWPENGPHLAHLPSSLAACWIPRLKSGRL